MTNWDWFLLGFAAGAWAGAIGVTALNVWINREPKKKRR